MSSLMLQFVMMLCGFITPKIILTYFGSDTNGLISSINQFLNYVQLLEGGVSGVIRAALYKPLADNDATRISAIINATKYFFRQIGAIYIIYVGIVAVIFPLMKPTEYSYSYYLLLVLILAINLLLQYFYSLTFQILLNADRKVFIVSLTHAGTILLNMTLVVIGIKFCKDILIIKLVSSLAFLIQPIFFSVYVRKHYRIDSRIPKDDVALKQRWDGFGINIAYFVHTNTDIIILTVFSTFADISVYSVYFMIISALKNLVISISSAILPSFGKVLVRKEGEKIHRTFDIYEYGIRTITVILFACCAVLITPFVLIYTSEISDANYNQFFFGIILTMAEMVYCLRDPYISVTYAVGKFKDVSWYAYTEAFLNIVISIVLVDLYGLIGVACGTLFSMVFRMICHGIYLRKNVLMRPIRSMIKNFVVNMLQIILIVLFCYRGIDLNAIFSYNEWFFLAVKVGAVAFCIVVLSNACFCPMETKIFYRAIVGRKGYEYE